MDTKFELDLCKQLEKLEKNSNLEIITHYDIAAIGKPDIMKCYCTGLENKFGTYKYTTQLSSLSTPIMHNYNTLERKRWTYAPERQLCEMLFEYCNNKSKNINTVILDNGFGCKIIR